MAEPHRRIDKNSRAEPELRPALRLKGLQFRTLVKGKLEKANAVLDQWDHDTSESRRRRLAGRI